MNEISLHLKLLLIPIVMWSSLWCETFEKTEGVFPRLAENEYGGLRDAMNNGNFIRKRLADILVFRIGETFWSLVQDDSQFRRTLSRYFLRYNLIVPHYWFTAMYLWTTGVLLLDLVAAAVLSGNRNFEGRVHHLTRANYLASPPLVVAYALAGTVCLRFPLSSYYSLD